MNKKRTILETVDLRKEFNGLTAVDSINISIRDNELLSIIGPNGAGKSTVVNLITGHLPPTRGEILYNGNDISKRSEPARTKLGIARSFQHPQLFDNLSVTENVYIAKLVKENEISRVHRTINTQDAGEGIRQLLENFGLDKFESSSAGELPHGARKSLDVAMAFAMNPNLMLLDEPTSGVSTKEKLSIIKSIKEVSSSRDMGLVMVEHDMELVAEHSDRVIALHEGRVLIDGDPENVLSSEKVETIIKGE